MASSLGTKDMINHLVADILITFPHRSIQEFLGALYFVLMLSTGDKCQQPAENRKIDNSFCYENPLVPSLLFLVVE